MLFMTTTTAYNSMVTDIHQPGTPRAELVGVVQRTWVLNGLLESELGEPVGRGISRWGGSGGGSRPPWNSMVAELVYQLHTQARELEIDMAAKASVGRQRRGGSRENTWLALSRLTILMEAVEDGDVMNALLTLRSWDHRAEVTLGRAEPVRRLPRDYGRGEPVCPWCQFTTLRCHVMRGLIFCVNPSCTDSDGLRPTAVMRVSPDGELTLSWQNGGDSVPAPITLKKVS